MKIDSFLEFVVLNGEIFPAIFESTILCIEFLLGRFWLFQERPLKSAILSFNSSAPPIRQRIVRETTIEILWIIFSSIILMLIVFLFLWNMKSWWKRHWRQIYYLGENYVFFFYNFFFMFESLNFIMKNKIKYALANYVD